MILMDREIRERILRSPNMVKGQERTKGAGNSWQNVATVRSCDRIGVCLEAAAATGTGRGQGCSDLLGDLRREAHEVLGISVLHENSCTCCTCILENIV